MVRGADILSWNGMLLTTPRISDDHRVRADVKRRFRAEVIAPQFDGADALKVFVEHAGDHA